MADEQKGMTAFFTREPKEWGDLVLKVGVGTVLAFWVLHLLTGSMQRQEEMLSMHAQSSLDTKATLDRTIPLLINVALAQCVNAAGDDKIQRSICFQGASGGNITAR